MPHRNEVTPRSSKSWNLTALLDAYPDVGTDEKFQYSRFQTGDEEAKGYELNATKHSRELHLPYVLRNSSFDSLLSLPTIRTFSKCLLVTLKRFILKNIEKQSQHNN
jgi:hypothetical protein